MPRFMNRRRRLRTVMAVLLLWQLGGAVAGVAAMACPGPAQAPAKTAAQHCHDQVATTAAGSDASQSEHPVPQGHADTPGEPPCCQGDCACVGGQGPPAVTSASTPLLRQTDHQVIGEQNSAHIVSRITELFRPPI